MIFDKRLILSMMCTVVLCSYGWAEDHDHDHHDHHGQEHEEEIHLKKESQELINLQKVKAKKSALLASIEVTGEVAVDSENSTHITSEKSGVLEKIDVELGEVVDVGTILCGIKTIDSIHEIKSQSHGVVMAIFLKSGDMVDTISSIMTIVDPDVMKASFNVYEKDLAAIKIGQKVHVRTIAYPDQTFEGEIVYVSPQVDAKTRTIKIRVNIKNEDHRLKFGMYLTGEILISLSEQALVVPEEAIQELEDKSVVFVPEAGEAEGFKTREVKVGRRTAGLAEILEGLSEDEEIVGKGSFYLKAELNKGELEHGHAH